MRHRLPRQCTFTSCLSLFAIQEGFGDVAEDRCRDVKYQSTPSKFGGAFAMAFGIFFGLAAVIAAPSFGQKLAYGVGELLLTVAGYRYGESNVTTSSEEVAIRNPLPSYELQWGEIDRFDVGRWKIEPAVCLVHQVDGSVRPAYGVTERGNFPNGSARRMVDELNRELAAQLPDRDETRPKEGAPGSAQEEHFRRSSSNLSGG